MTLASSAYDYGYKSVNDNFTAQNMRDNCLGLVQGKMLGGSSAIYHMMVTRGDPYDYNQWANMLNDTAWNYTNLLPYFEKMEKLTDPELLDSQFVNLHGTDGMIKIRREKSSKTSNFLAAFEELGNKIVMDSTSDTSNLGYYEPLFAIDDGIRQSSALAYLVPAKNRPNLCISLFTTATKILIEKGVAIGVQVNTSNNESYALYANNEVILSAGVFNSPKVLMLSGIGPRQHLESMGIDVVADLPVGQNFMDQPCAPVIYQMEESSEVTAAFNPHQFPVPSFAGNVALNKSQSWPDYQSISLVFSPNSTDLLQLCSIMFSFSNEICQKFYEASINKITLFSLIGLGLPESRGEVMLTSTDPSEAPLVYPRMYSNRSDLTLIAKSFLDHNRVLNTTYFRSVNATLLDLGLCKETTTDMEFWECYSIAMSTTMWHYGGTCAMGLVLDSRFRVKGVESLRVVDSSAMPMLVNAKIYAAVGMLAERAADFILYS